MKLSFIFELLLIFILIAFAASAAVRDSKLKHKHTRKQHPVTVKRPNGKVSHKNRQDQAPNRFCSCSTKLCNCCREFNIPVVALQGPGCASLQYLKGDRLAISMSFGERVLTNTTINSNKPQPVCMPLPGGVSKFCGRVYNIKRKGDDFNACLGLELRSLQEVEAALRVSCFRFGPQGLRVEPSQPLPVVEDEDDDEEDDDDDDDDDEDDDEDEFDFDDEDDEENDVDSTDYGTFSVFDDDFIGEYFQGGSGSSGNKKPVKKATTTIAPVRRIPTKNLVKKPTKSTQQKPLRKRPLLNKQTPKPTIKTSTTTTSTTTTTEKPIITTDRNLNINTIKMEDEHQYVPISTMSPEEVTKRSNLISSTTNSMMEMSFESADIAGSGDGEVETSTIKYFILKNDEINSDEDDDSDPISDTVEEIIDDEDDDDENDSNENRPTDKLTNTTMSIRNVTKTDKKESKDVLEDIVDEVVDTFTGDDEGDKSKVEDDDDEDDDILDDDDDEEEEDDDDEDDDEEDDDSEEQARTLKRTRNTVGHRQSRDMWLDRLHW